MIILHNTEEDQQLTSIYVKKLIPKQIPEQWTIVKSDTYAPVPPKD